MSKNAKCNMQFDNRTAYKRHLERKKPCVVDESKYKYKCDKCNYRCKRRSLLENHILKNKCDKHIGVKSKMDVINKTITIENSGNNVGFNIIGDNSDVTGDNSNNIGDNSNNIGDNSNNITNNNVTNIINNPIVKVYINIIGYGKEDLSSHMRQKMIFYIFFLWV